MKENKTIQKGNTIARSAKECAYLAVFVAAIACPVVNSGVFFLGGVVFFMESIEAYFKTSNGPLFIITTLIGINFLVELAINVILAPVILRIINIKKPQSK